MSKGEKIMEHDHLVGYEEIGTDRTIQEIRLVPESKLLESKAYYMAYIENGSDSTSRFVRFGVCPHCATEIDWENLFRVLKRL